jgi:hypothetical protein
MITTYFEVRFYVTGIKKGERKVKRHSIRLVNAPITITVTDKEKLINIIEEARTTTDTIMKTIVNGNNHLSFCHTSEDSEKHEMITSEPFNELNFQLKVE